MTTRLAKHRPLELGLDQPALYARGLDRLRTVVGESWTDHNLHDPGITILELAAYALTDLTYRASIPLPNLMATGEAFGPWSAGKMLPNRPWTVLDYRKLMIDVPGVKNAWLEHAPQPCAVNLETGEVVTTKPSGPGFKDVRIAGVYQPRIEYAGRITSNVDKKAVRVGVLKQLLAHRNLCEDFLEVEEVQTQRFLLCGEIDLEPDGDVPLVHQTILERVQAYLAPGVARYSRDQMLARRHPDATLYTAADLFDGPVLAHGFIDSEELRAADLRTEVRLSDIISIVMDVTGVRAVRELLVAPDKSPGDLTPVENRWVVRVEQGRQPTLDPLQSRLVYYKRNMPVVAPQVAALPPEPDSAATVEDIAIPVGRVRDVSTFTSFQRDFPALYGVVGNPLPATTSARRRILADQLKAYLQFFDQVMANYCSQLAHVKELFATAEGIAPTPTYFTQVVSDEPAYQALYGTATLTQIKAHLSKSLEEPEQRLERRTRFLDHLIARVAERFNEYVGIMRSTFGVGGIRLLRDRSAFLEDYAAISRDRGGAYDYTDAATRWDSDANVSGLERRVARLLGIANHARRDLTGTIAPAAGAVVTNPATGQFGFTVEESSGPAARLLVKENALVATSALAGAQLRRVFELGLLSSSYRRVGSNGFTIAEADGTVVGRSPDFADAQERDAAILAARSYFRTHDPRDGFFVIENMLLRPIASGEATLRACIEPGCDDCAGEVYSYRIHIVLPAYAGRFNDMDFRRFVEQTIREEVPAHILPKICWIADGQMQELQKAYREWLEVLDGTAAGDRGPRLSALVDVLTRIKSVYPVQKLIACGDGSEDKFIVGRTALGTKPV
jgi:uncharacterized protein